MKSHTITSSKLLRKGFRNAEKVKENPIVVLTEKVIDLIRFILK